MSMVLDGIFAGAEFRGLFLCFVCVSWLGVSTMFHRCVFRPVSWQCVATVLTVFHCYEFRLCLIPASFVCVSCVVFCDCVHCYVFHGSRPSEHTVCGYTHKCSLDIPTNQYGVLLQILPCPRIRHASIHTSTQCLNFPLNSWEKKRKKIDVGLTYAHCIKLYTEILFHYYCLLYFVGFRAGLFLYYCLLFLVGFKWKY